MKIQIELDSSLSENEIRIRCPRLTDDIYRLEQLLSQMDPSGQKLRCQKGNTQYYLSPDDILFFETEAGGVVAHTEQDIFETNQKLYELEEILPRYFMRISKSAILNTRKVYAINRNIAASGAVEFRNSHKQVYVSRNYYKALIEQLELTHLRKTQAHPT